MRRWSIAMLAWCFVGGCSDPLTISSIGELDVVLAVRDDTVNFGAIATFAMPDTIVHLDELGVGTVSVSRRFDAQILERLAANFESRGYVRERAPFDSRPDLVVLVTATGSEHVTAWVTYPWYPYWGWYGGFSYYSGFGPGWGFGYPWLPTVGGFTWQSGTLLVDAIDARRIDTLRMRLPAVWAGAMNGVLGGESSSAEQRVLAGIDEMFTLSPYLRREP